MNFFNRKPLQLLVGATLVVSTLFVSCDKDDAIEDQTYAISGNGSGSQVSPSNSSTATGTMTGSYNARTKVLQYNIGWSNLTTTAGLVQVYGPASAGVNGSLLFPLTITTPGVNGSASGTITLNATQEAALLANSIYYTVSSSTYPSGEIRGQIIATAN